MDLLYFLSWYLAATLAGWIAFPLIFRLFCFLPDRGIAFAKAAGLLLVMFLFWLLGSFGFLRNDSSGLLLAVLILIGVQAAWLKKDGLATAFRWVAQHGSYALLCELLFLAAFAGWTVIRAYNPAIDGTEKPMEYMLINSILHSPTLPPGDAWLSGYAISYYYFGYFIVASLARLAATPPAVAFNLGLALVFGLTALGATGLVVNLLALVKGARSKTDSAPPAHLVSAFLPGLLGCLMVLFVGNYYGALELVRDNGGLADLQIPAIYYDYGSGPDLSKVQSLQQMQRQPGIQVGMVNFWQWLDIKQLGPLPAGQKPATVHWDSPNWFFAARVVHDRNLIGVETEAIDEVPAFSFLLGDLHPHVLALPFDILAAALALQWLLNAIRRGQNISRGASPAVEAGTWVRLGLSAVLLGGLIFLNTWDFPIHWFLITAAWVAGFGLTLGFKRLQNAWRQVLPMPVLLLAGSLLFYLPFLIVFQSQAGGIAPNLVYPTRFQQAFVMFGPVWLATALFLLWLLRWQRKSISHRAALYTAGGLLLGLAALDLFLSSANFLQANASSPDFYPLTLAQATGLWLQRRLVDSSTALIAALMVGYTISFVLALARPAPEAASEAGEERATGGELPAYPALLLAAVMILTGALLALGPEFVFLRDNFGTRMNTIFKFYFQAWILWGLAGAFGIGYLLSVLTGVRRSGVALLACLALLPGLYYLYGGLISRTGNFASPPTLNGMRYFSQIYPDDWAAIQWLEQNVSGTPVILEGSLGAYWSDGPSSRFSMATGLPTLMGWANHEGQWRGNGFSQVAARQDDIRKIYQAGDWKITADLLDQYHVGYVIVSTWEKNWYRPVNVAKFDRNLTKVFSIGDVTIYQR